MIILFILAAVALVGMCIAMLMPALHGRLPINDGQIAQQNIGIARRRLAELEVGNDDDTVAQARAEIELALLDDLDEPDNSDSDHPPKSRLPKNPGKTGSAFITAMIVLISLGMYLKIGNPHALAPPYNTTNYSASAETPPLEVLLSQLETRLATHPNDAEGWELAGKTYMQIRQFTKAEKAYQALHTLRNDDADVLIAWANATVLANNGTYTAPALARIARALALNPQHENALWSAALGAASHENTQQALTYLQQLLPLLVNDPVAYEQTTQFIERVQQMRESNPTGTETTDERGN